MSVNKVTGGINHYSGNPTSKTKAGQSKVTDHEENRKKAQNPAAVYDKTPVEKERKTVYQRDNATVEQLMEEVEKRSQSLRELVEKMLLKQGQTFTDATDIYALLREGKVEVDPETQAQAQKDIAEDGYWGVEQTSERLVSFAKALTGGDPSKADEMIAAVEKGFEQATKDWGDELPTICKDTLDAAISKLESWRDSKNEADEMGTVAKTVFLNRAAAGKL